MTKTEFRRQIRNERAAIRLFEKVRWGDYPVCPKCHNCGPVVPFENYHVGYWRCRECRISFSVKQGTIMAHSLMPLDKWLLAAVLVGQDDPTVVEMIEKLGVAHVTAWAAIKRVRTACGELTGEESLVDIAGRLLAARHELLPDSQRKARARESEAQGSQMSVS